MILVIGTVRVPESAFEREHAAMERMVSETRKEDGCIRYSYARDLLDPGLLHVSEAWRDRDALKAHFTSPHMAEWQKVVAGIGASDRDLRLYETDAGERI
jgi:quinol monooxygenase YgiN